MKTSSKAKKITKNTNRYVADFETTTYNGQHSTEVWAAAIVKEGTDDVQLFNGIAPFWDYLMSIPDDIVVYFHNLKFDGEFLLSYILGTLHYEQAFSKCENPYYSELDSFEILSKKDMPNESIEYLISKQGQWYSITVRDANSRYIEFRDSYKLIPLSVEDMGKAFNTEHQKLSIEYDKHRAAGETISGDEAAYIKNDVLVVKEALEYMWNDGHDKLTIGACCLSEFKRLYAEDEKRRHTPKEKAGYHKRYHDLVYYKLDDPTREPIWGARDADEYIRNAYKGGWCYVNPYMAGKTVGEGVTLDVCSLYPSVMHSDSGSRYPWGEPHFWKGDIPDNVKNDDSLYYFVRFRTRFYLKPGRLPFVSIKGNPLYRPHDMLETSDVRDPLTGKWCRQLSTPDGKIKQATVEMTMTCTDWVLFQEQYDLEDLEILDGCWFNTTKGLFDSYIEKWADVKKRSTGGMRQIAKLFLNNLYGKMAASCRSDFKMARLDKDGVMRYTICYANDKTPGYIPIGAAITAYARNFTIRAAQLNYHLDLPGFLYADTDSMHLNIPVEEVKGVKIDPVELNHWKIEAEWDAGKFVRAKTYIERLPNGNWNIKCAGMPKTCKDLFIEGMTDAENARPKEELQGYERDFLYSKSGKKRRYTMDDFDIGLQIPGKLMPKRIPGGVIFLDDVYTMKRDLWFECP